MELSRVDKAIEVVAKFTALLVGSFHLLNVAGVFVPSTMYVRIFHLMLMMAIVFLIKPSFDKEGKKWPVFDRIFRIAGFLLSIGTGVFLLSRWEAIALSGGVTQSMDIVVSFIVVVLVFESTRRAVGKVLVFIALVFLLYPFLSPYLPGVFRTRGFSFTRVFAFLSNTQGLYGIPLGVSATYIILFTTYGAFLNEFGAGEFFYKLSRALTKNAVAASAKSAVVFSTFIGMISGSAAGNVAVTGSFTIPLMKREGYESHQAGAIEAVVSTGGQIMPPIMGAAAFIMAEIIGTPYVNIMKSAVVPALLFFTSIFLVVHLQALKNGIVRKSESEDSQEQEKVSSILFHGIPYILPFATLVVLMVTGYSPFKGAFYSIIMLVVFFAIWQRRIDKELIRKIGVSVMKGAKSAVPIAVACAAAGIISGVLSVSGLGSKLSTMIISLSQGNIFLALLFTMITSIILGMGLPTTAAYLILATVVAPALANMGVPLLTAHLFVFFYGCISSITPPVALASYIAAGIADADINKVGWTAFRYGLTSYVLPFMFFYNSALLLQGSPVSIVGNILLSLVGIGSIAISIVGFYKAQVTVVLRVLLFAAGLLMIYSGLIPRIIGILLFLVIIVLNIRKSRQLITG